MTILTPLTGLLDPSLLHKSQNFRATQSQLSRHTVTLGLSSLLSSSALFESPNPAGRRITMGFSWMQRLGHGATFDVWFPSILKQELDRIMETGITLGDEHFPVEWAAVRQFELLQDAGNYKIYNMQSDYLLRSLYEQTKNMRGGGYRVTLVTVGSYGDADNEDELEILDKRLQERLSQIVHMLYLEDQSLSINDQHDMNLAAECWSMQNALPHVGMTLGARDLFKPVGGGIRPATTTIIVPPSPHCITLENWVAHIGTTDTATGEPLRYMATYPIADSFSFQNGIYQFAAGDEGRTLDITYLRRRTETEQHDRRTLSEKRHQLAQTFFDLLEQLPQNHIVHDTAIGLQLPEMINENEWLYIPESDESLYAFNRLLSDVFRPFDMLSMSKLDGRDDARSEVKPTTQHMRGYGDRMTPGAAEFQRQMAAFMLA
jgi:hypothetical protein